jgi:hypothetical protein
MTYLFIIAATALAGVAYIIFFALPMIYEDIADINKKLRELAARIKRGPRSWWGE